MLAQAMPGMAAPCPTVADAKGLQTAFPEQAEIEEAAGLGLAYSENPLFDADAKAGKLPPVAERLPEQPLIVLPYEDCGQYGGTIERHLARADLGHLRHPELAAGGAGAHLATISDHRAERGAVVELGRRLQAMTFELRKGHKWSDGEPFTADDVVFFFEDIIENKDLNPETTEEWGVNSHAKAVDETHVEIALRSSRSRGCSPTWRLAGRISHVPPKHFFAKIMPKYNPKANDDAKAGGVRGLDQTVHQLLSEMARRRDGDGGRAGGADAREPRRRR